MSTATTTVRPATRVRLNDGRFGTVKNLFGGCLNAEAPAPAAPAKITVGDRDLQDLLKEAKKANFQKMVLEGKALMLEATKAVGVKDSAAALRAMWRNRYACACYLTSEASKRHHRFMPVSQGFHELELMEDFLVEQAKKAGQEVPQRPKRK